MLAVEHLRYKNDLTAAAIERSPLDILLIEVKEIEGSPYYLMNDILFFYRYEMLTHFLNHVVITSKLMHPNKNSI